MDNSPPTPASTGSVKSSTSSSSKSSTKSSQKKKGRTKVLYFWSSEDVNKWLRKHCGQYHQMYGHHFLEHEICGRALVRLTDAKLLHIGITNSQDREELMRHILRLKLKTESTELKTIDQRDRAPFNQK